jgi:hypothetical protein
LTAFGLSPGFVVDNFRQATDISDAGNGNRNGLLFSSQVDWRENTENRNCASDA